VTTSGAGTPPAGFWCARHPAPDGGLTVVGVAGTAFPDGTVVELPGPAARPAGWQFEAHAPSSGRPPSRVVVSEDTAAGAPHLWAVLMQAADGSGTDLVAFSTPARPDGAVVTPGEVPALGVGWGEQSGAVRWSPSTGVISQVYVAPAHRRRRVATKLLLMAGGVQALIGQAWLHSDGRLTDLGDAWLSRQPDWWRQRVPVRAEHLPPMTPPTEATGVPVRNLEPDVGS
jgi:GNAT superfamily N-acetyltransferase